MKENSIIWKKVRIKDIGLQDYDGQEIVGMLGNDGSFMTTENVRFTEDMFDIIDHDPLGIKQEQPLNAKEWLIFFDDSICEAVSNGFEIHLEDDKLIEKMEAYYQYRIDFNK